MGTLKGTPRRTIEAVWIEEVGPVTARELLEMDDDSWGHLRDRIRREKGKASLIARCMACGGEVYVRATRIGAVNKPLFAHYTGSDPYCRWYTGKNIAPNDARAAQYQGQQESLVHRMMCDLIGELAERDPRYIGHTVDEYLTPTLGAHGRYPDVCVDWKGFGRFAVEFQMSGTFQTEISARCEHYKREGIPLLWVLPDLDTTLPLPQNITDIIRRHRGNAFVLDQASITASRDQSTLVLTVYAKNQVGFDAPRLVRVDELTIPPSMLPYWEDRFIAPLLEKIRGRRRPWFAQFENWDKRTPLNDLDLTQSLLVAAAFSIVEKANGRDTNYASMHINVSAMLNAYLNTKRFAPYTNLLTQLIENTACSNLLETSVGEHLRRYRRERQADEHSQEWQLIQNLLPESLDQLIRDRLSFYDALPSWARPVAQG
jgi:hypothetical protein